MSSEIELILEISYKVKEIEDGNYMVTSASLKFYSSCYFINFLIRISGECKIIPRGMAREIDDIFRYIIFEDVYYRPLREVMDDRLKNLFEKRIFPREIGIWKPTEGKNFYPVYHPSWKTGEPVSLSSLTPNVHLELKGVGIDYIEFIVTLNYPFVVCEIDENELKKEFEKVIQSLQEHKGELEEVLKEVLKEGVKMAYVGKGVAKERVSASLLYDLVERRFGEDFVEVEIDEITYHPYRTMYTNSHVYNWEKILLQNLVVKNLSLLKDPRTSLLYLSIFIHPSSSRKLPLLQPFLDYLSTKSDEELKRLVKVVEISVEK
ncbi:MAG: hypothetical protein QW815_00040 [Nitrososphaerota archaeon]